MKRRVLFGAIIAITLSLLCVKGYAQDLVIADFEGHPNKLGGDVGVYGSLEPNWDDKASPYSWYYEPNKAGYSKNNVHAGAQSFRLVNGLGSKKDETWGSFAMDMGPTLDLTPTPKKVHSKDVSGYKYLTFWVKGEKGDENMEILFRDSHAASYMPQAKYKVTGITPEWKKISLPLDEVKNMGIDLKSLDNVGVAFGPDVGNTPGATVYLDDFSFSNEK